MGLLWEGVSPGTSRSQRKKLCFAPSLQPHLSPTITSGLPRNTRGYAVQKIPPNSAVVHRGPLGAIPLHADLGGVPPVLITLVFHLFPLYLVAYIVGVKLLFGLQRLHAFFAH